MLGTHSELHWGQMSHICDISPLRLKQILSMNEAILTHDTIEEGREFQRGITLIKKNI